MKMKHICKLQRAKAIECIKDSNQVFHRHGVWNSYKIKNTNDVIKDIEKSGYGADVFLNEEDGNYYVSVPVSSDMW